MYVDIGLRFFVFCPSNNCLNNTPNTLRLCFIGIINLINPKKFEKSYADFHDTYI